MTVKQIGYVVSGMLILAIFKLPIGYYTFLRICVTGICAFFMHQEYKDSGGRLEFLVILFAILTIIFNPFIPIHLEKGVWIFIDIGAALAIATYATQKR
jgi:hypothetical protein